MPRHQAPTSLWGPEFQEPQRRHEPNSGRMGAGAAPYSAYTRPGDGPARDELWGKTEPDDWLHDKNQNHKPSHGVQRGLNVGEMTSHEWDVVPDKRSQATTAANMTVPEFGNHWGAKSGAYTTIAHHGRFGKGTTRRNASAFQTADDVCNLTADRETFY